MESRLKRKASRYNTVSNALFQDDGAILSQVKEGDIIEVDIELRPKGSATAVTKGKKIRKRAIVLAGKR